MNLRMKRLKRFYLSIPTATAAEFTYYFNSDENNTITTDYYYGTNENVKVPSKIDGFTVTEVGPYTFSLGSLKTEEMEKPDNAQDITSIVFSNGITKI